MTPQAVWESEVEPHQAGVAHAIEEGSVTTLCGMVVLGSILGAWPPTGSSVCHVCSREADPAASAGDGVSTAGEAHDWRIESAQVLHHVIYYVECCGCGWTGSARSSVEEANVDGREHVATSS